MKQGFTLVETLIVIALVGIGVVVIANMFMSQNRLYLNQNAELEVTSSVRTSLDDIDNYVRQANRTLSSYSTYTANSDVLILQIQSINASNRLIPGVYDYVIYSVSGGNLTREIIADATSSRVSNTKLLGTSITDLNFTYNNADYALVTEVATSITSTKSGRDVRTFSADTQSKLRAY